MVRVEDVCEQKGSFGREVEPQDICAGRVVRRARGRLAWRKLGGTARTGARLLDTNVGVVGEWVHGKPSEA